MSCTEKGAGAISLHRFPATGIVCFKEFRLFERGPGNGYPVLSRIADSMQVRSNISQSRSGGAPSNV